MYWWNQPSDVVVKKEEETPTYCNYHEFPDTGMLKSWCKKCGREGYFCRKTQKYVIYKEHAQNTVDNPEEYLND